jgi:hypothetical protein
LRPAKAAYILPSLLNPRQSDLWKTAKDQDHDSQEGSKYEKTIQAAVVNCGPDRIVRRGESFGDSGTGSVRATLSGFNEVPPINSPGSGRFQATIFSDHLTYTLTYSGLTSDATQSHVHFGQPGVNGGVYFFLCSNVGTPAGITTPACPVSGGTVTGTITAADIIPVPTQNITAGDFASAVKIILAGVGYANVHSNNFKAGEIRGQVKNSDD